jgi:hypothetical protein
MELDGFRGAPSDDTRYRVWTHSGFAEGDFPLRAGVFSLSSIGGSFVQLHLCDYPVGSFPFFVSNNKRTLFEVNS